MREIKFKVWNPIYGMMEPADIFQMTTFESEPGKKIIGVCYPPETIFLQFTGLRDNNETEIYESDLLSLFTKDLTTKFLYVVKYEDAKFVLYHANNDHGKWGDLHRAFDPDFKDYGFSIVGNIYENLELAQGN